MRNIFGQSIGDEQEVKCPSCEHPHCFQDWVYEGFTGQDNYPCEGCGELLDVDVELDCTFVITMETVE